MRRKISWLIGGLLALLQLMANPPRSSAGTAMIFCNGNDNTYNMGSASGLTTSQINGFRASGFTTMVLFTMSVLTNGDFYYAGQTICTNGVYNGPSNWGSLLAQCKTAPSSVTRIEMGLSGAGDTSWTNIKNLIAANGTNSTTVLYQNLNALKTALGIDAIDSDDESAFDSASAIKFGKMCGSVGLKMTLCPYNNGGVSGYWATVQAGLGTNCDAIYLQCYDGGAGNDPATWNTYFSGLKVIPGYWDYERSSIFLTNMMTWSNAGGPGGFLWPSCTGCNPPAGPGEMLQYAGWIQTAFDSMVVTPATGFAGAAAYNLRALPASMPFTITNSGASTFSWSLINTSSWLNVSSLSGTLTGGTVTTTTISLVASVATNLAPGVYAATVIFSNQTSKVTVSRNFTLNTAVYNWPIALTGYNAALLASNNATAGSPGATAFDIPNNYCLYQQGLSGSTRGLPLNGIFPSQSDSSTVFQFGPYGAADALILGDTYAKSGTLNLANPDAFNSLTILAASANGGGQGTFVLNFTNGTKSPVLAFNCQDWFGTVTNVAIQGFGRLQLGASLTVQDNGSSNPNLYQTTFNLVALGLTLPVASITFSNPATAGASQTTAIFGISGMSGNVQLQPPTGLTAIPGTNGTVQLSWKSSVGATNYIIRQSLVSGGSYVPVGSTTGTGFAISGLANGTIYYFVVSAVGAFNESANTSQVSAMPGSYQGWMFGANPTAYWPLNETVGPVANEMVRGSNGVYNGSYSLLTGGASGAGFASPHRVVFFSGTSGYTQIPRLIGNTNFSIVFWVKTSATGGTPNWYNGQGLVDGEVGGVTGDFGVALVGGKVGFGIGNPDTTLTSVAAINNSVWHQVAVTRNSGNGAMTICLDGKFDSTVTGPTGARTAPPNLRIGSIQSGGGFFNGYLSDVALYEQVLTTNQIAILYSAATGLFYNVTLTNNWSGGNLVLSWPGNGKLLETTNLSGPWTTNVSASPATIAPNQPQKFYRIKTQ
ncbi:MAG TPA: LamG-like jellyroll fold domain-containing protein [Verrucomicrobiae bacterium]|nr:LamG-like jellyroll fold domain-containing protein [Verrucomicrobiae bacterium]